jgi:hypothetical protein
MRRTDKTLSCALLNLTCLWDCVVPNSQLANENGAGFDGFIFTTQLPILPAALGTCAISVPLLSLSVLIIIM